MALNELTSTAVQLYDKWIKDAGKMTNNTLSNVLEARHCINIKHAVVLKKKQKSNNYILYKCHMMMQRTTRN